MKIIDHNGMNLTNKMLQLRATGEPTFGGAYHSYEVLIIDKAGLEEPKVICTVNFQNGPIAEAGVNGVTQEILLAIVIDRLAAFQAGNFACRENAVALTHIETALLWLEKRTRDRIRRNVEGVYKP